MRLRQVLAGAVALAIAASMPVIVALEFVKSTMPAYEGIPDEVFQRALYMTETFTKES